MNVEKIISPCNPIFTYRDVEDPSTSYQLHPIHITVNIRRPSPIVAINPRSSTSTIATAVTRLATATHPATSVFTSATAACPCSSPPQSPNNLRSRRTAIATAPIPYHHIVVHLQPPRATCWETIAKHHTSVDLQSTALS